MNINYLFLSLELEHSKIDLKVVWIEEIKDRSKGQLMEMITRINKFYQYKRTP
jgi:hypothetical protein